MQRPIPASSRTRYRVGAAASLVLALAIGFLTFAPAASAHHPEITASTACDSRRRLPRLVRVDLVADLGRQRRRRRQPPRRHRLPPRTDGGNASALDHPHLEDRLPLHGRERPTASPTRSRSPTSARATEIQVRATAAANWGNGSGGGQTTDTSWQTFPTNCQPPGSPSVGSSVACANGNGDVTITLANTAVAGRQVGHLRGHRSPHQRHDHQDPRRRARPTPSCSPGFPDGPVTIPVTADTIHHDQTLTVGCDRAGHPVGQRPGRSAPTATATSRSPSPTPAATCP